MDKAAVEMIVKNGQAANRLFAWANFISIMNFSIFPCLCGYLGFHALPGSLVGLMLACWGFAVKKKTTKLTVWMWVVPMLVPVLVFLKNVADILLFGHNAILLSY